MKLAAWLVAFSIVACKSKEAPQAAQTSAPLTLEASDTIWAASAHLRIVDATAGRVVKGIDLQKAVRNLVFSADGSRAWVAASDGVREVDAEKQEVVAKLTELPARNVELSEDGRSVYVLEHRVIVHEDQTREILPFRLVTIDAATRAVTSDEEIGQRVLYAHPASKDRWGVVAFEDARVRKIPPGAKLSADGEPIEHGGRVREGGMVHAGVAYLPIEAKDHSRVLAIDLTKGEASMLELDRPYTLRGIAFAGDRLWVDAGVVLLAVDLKTRTIVKSMDLAAAHTGISISSDGKLAYLAQTVDGSGGAVTAIALDGTTKKKIHLEDISPWALAVRPKR